MLIRNNKFRVLLFSALATFGVIAAKLLLHWLGWEILALSALHTSIIAGSFFVISFILSATIADYKEAEKLPSEFSATIENMYYDAVSIKSNYPDFNLETFKEKLLQIAKTFQSNVRSIDKQTHHQIQELSLLLANMEAAKVPPNFIAKLKQEQAQLVKGLYRIDYIKTIRFIPSAFILAQLVSALTIGLLLITAVEPFYAGLGLTAIIAFLLVYILYLIDTISVPFRPSGTTQDDVSLFLVSRTITHLDKHEH